MAVTDANIAVALLVDLPWSIEARLMLAADPQPIAPALFAAEVANSLSQYAQHGVLTAGGARAGLADLMSLIEAVPDGPLADGALQIAMAHDHSVYDCLYIALAQRERALLLTADRKLASLARRTGIAARLLL